MITLREPRCCCWISSGLTDVTVMKSIRFVWKGQALRVESGFISDCSSVPVWWAIQGCALATLAAIWLLAPETALLVGCLLFVFQAAIGTLRKAQLIPAGIIHDAAYSGRLLIDDDTAHNGTQLIISRADADALYRHCLSSYALLAVPAIIRWIPAWLAWAALRIFGRSHYYRL